MTLAIEDLTYTSGKLSYDDAKAAAKQYFAEKGYGDVSLISKRVVAGYEFTALAAPFGENPYISPDYAANLSAFEVDMREREKAASDKPAE